MSVLANSWSPILLRHRAVPEDISLASTVLTTLIQSVHLPKLVFCSWQRLSTQFYVYTKLKRSH